MQVFGHQTPTPALELTNACRAIHPEPSEWAYGNNNAERTAWLSFRLPTTPADIRPLGHQPPASRLSGKNLYNQLATGDPQSSKSGASAHVDSVGITRVSATTDQRAVAAPHALRAEDRFAAIAVSGAIAA